MKKDIYIIKNSVNNKVYIGQSKDAAQRWLGHIYDARYRKKHRKKMQVIQKAMMKYGIEKFHYEVLEYQVDNADEREIYWIQRYNSVIPNGYNVAPGGKSCGTGLSHPASVFRDEGDLMSCISDISSGTKTFTNIARKYGCSPEVIVSINKGCRYHMDWLKYPLRSACNKYSPELVRQIRYSLKYELDLTYKDICDKYNVDSSQVSEINQGKIHYVASDKYPLRSKRKRDLSPDVVRQIVDDILYSELPMSGIARKYNISRSRVSSINSGMAYKMSGRKYPIREPSDPRNQTKQKYLELEILDSIRKLLRDANISVNEIAAKFGVTPTTIYSINDGKCKKYMCSDWDYPIRSFKQPSVSTIPA